MGLDVADAVDDTDAVRAVVLCDDVLTRRQLHRVAWIMQFFRHINLFTQKKEDFA